MLKSLNLAPNQIVVSEVPSTFGASEAAIQDINKKWQELLDDSVKKGSQLWDQEVVRYEDHEMIDGVLSLRVSRIPFSIRYPLRFMRDQILNEPGLEPHGMIVQLVITTSDGKYVFW